MADYDIGEAFREIEQALIESLRGNWEIGADGDFTAWQAEQLKALERFRKENEELFSERFEAINAEVEKALHASYAKGDDAEVKRIEKAIKDGYVTTSKPTTQFFGVNEERLRALIKATTDDLKTAETAVLRMADDIYRKTIFNAQTAYSSGAFTLRQAVDMASRDFLVQGVACVEYTNGARVNIASYAEMALRTANKRAKMQGETNARDELGVNTVIVTRRGVACPKCIQFCGKVFYDDVYSDLPVPDKKYPRLSTAIAGGLYHPNCKDSHSTYFEGVSSPPRRLTKAEIEQANKVYEFEQKQHYNERMIRKYKRLATGSIDADNQAFYKSKVKRWQAAQREFIEANGDFLRRDYSREQI